MSMAAPPAPTHAPARLDAAAVDAVFADCAEPGAPGAAVLVVQGGRVLHKRAYGLADVENGLPLTPCTKLHLGSATKHMCAAGVALLETRGALRLDDPVGRFVSELSDAVGAITLRQLLSMTSGLFDGLTLPLFAGLANGGLSQRRHFDILSRLDRLMFRPGDDHTYSNSNYLLISRVIERVSGAALGDFMREALFAPLGMTATELVADPTGVEGRARGYQIDRDGTARPAADMTDLCADGGVVTTLDDMERWLAHLAHGRIGDIEVHARLGEEAVLSDGARTGYGLGLAVGSALGRAKLSHAGGMPGYVADVAYFPQDDLGMVMMSNRFQPDLIDRTDRIAALALGLPAPQAAPPAVAETLSGVYVCRTLGCTAEFTRDGDETALHLMGERLRLAEAGAGVYRVIKPGMRLEARVLDEQLHGRPKLAFAWGGGRAAIFVPFSSGRDVGALRLDDYVGAYRSPLLGETHHVSHRGDALEIGLASALRSLLWGDMKPRGSDMFSCVIPGEPSDTDVTVQFQRDANGRVTSLEYTLSRTRGLRFLKLA